MQDLGALPNDSISVASGINDSGQIVGVCESVDSNNLVSGSSAFLWTVNNGMQDLGALQGDNSASAVGINVVGQVVGSSRVFNPQGSFANAFLWSSVGGMQYLGDLPGGNTNSNAVAINASGQVVGTGTDPLPEN